MNTAAMSALWPHDIVRRLQNNLIAALLLAPAVLCAATSLAEGQTRPRPRPDVQEPLQAPMPNVAVPQPRPAAGPAQTDAPLVNPDAGDLRKGPVTGQPLPRYVSLKGSEGNARRGPGLTHRIDWVFTTAGTPLRVTAEYVNWRRVEDFEGFGGWVHFALLSGARYVIITQDMASFHRLPDASLPVSFHAERGVLARILECSIDWCRVNADGQRGWARKTALWGVDANEIVE